MKKYLREDPPGSGSFVFLEGYQSEKAIMEGLEGVEDLDVRRGLSDLLKSVILLQDEHDEVGAKTCPVSVRRSLWCMWERETGRERLEGQESGQGGIVWVACSHPFHVRLRRKSFTRGLAWIRLGHGRSLMSTTATRWQGFARTFSMGARRPFGSDMPFAPCRS